MKYRELSKEEWHHVRTLRGQRLTGYTAHRVHTKPIKNQPSHVHVVRGCGPTYYWPMGSQPATTLIEHIARRCPLDAAAAFLSMFERGNEEKTNPPLRKEQK